MPSGSNGWPRTRRSKRSSWTIRSARSRAAPSARRPSSSATRSSSARTGSVTSRSWFSQGGDRTQRCELRPAAPVLLSCGSPTPNDGEEGWLRELHVANSRSPPARQAWRGWVSAHGPRPLIPKRCALFRKPMCRCSIRSGPRPTSPAIMAIWCSTRCSRSTRSSSRTRRWSTGSRSLRTS